MEQASIFIEKLASTGENVLLNFDNFLTVDDIIKGRKDICFKWHITSSLIVDDIIKGRKDICFKWHITSSLWMTSSKDVRTFVLNGILLPHCG